MQAEYQAVTQLRVELEKELEDSRGKLEEVEGRLKKAKKERNEFSK